MDSLNVVNDINKRMGELDEKITKTSKSAAAAFSYLYSQIEEIDLNDVQSKINFTNERLTYITSNTAVFTADIESKVTGMQNQLTEVSKSITDQINGIREDISFLQEKMFDIIKVPEQYIVVKKENKGLKGFFKDISDFFYMVFHRKKVREERELAYMREKARIEAEERIKIEDERRRKAAQEKRSAEAKSKIKNIIKA